MAVYRPTEFALTAASELWGLTGQPEFLRKVGNHVYRAKREGQNTYLRFTDSSWRTQQQIESELDFQLYAARALPNTVKPIASKNGRYVHAIGTHFAVLFEEARGIPYFGKDHYGADFVRMSARSMARFHCATERYRPSEGIVRRPDWDQETVYLYSKKALHLVDKESQDLFKRLETQITQLDRSKDYRLVHCDYHHGNSWINGDSLSAFDFDDCCYHWLDYDLAVPLDALIRSAIGLETGLSSQEVQEIYLEAYEAEAGRSVSRAHLKLFLPFRALLIMLYCSYTRNDMDEKSQSGLDGFLELDRQVLGVYSQEIA